MPSNTTPELYVGSDSGRGELADNEEYGAMGQPVNYPDRGPPQTQDLPQVTGTWTDEGQYLQADATAHLRLEFQADTVYVVAGTGGAVAARFPSPLTGSRWPPSNSGPALTSSGFTVTRQDLFQLLTGVSSGYHLIDLTVPAGFRIYTFTFG